MTTRENPVRIVTHPVTGQPEPSFNNEFTAWLLDTPQLLVETESTLHGTFLGDKLPRSAKQLPQDWLDKGRAKSKRLKEMGLVDMEDIIKFFMDGGDA